MRRDPSTIIRSLAVGAVVAVLAVFLGAGPAAAHESDEGILAVIDDHRVVVTAAVPFDQLGYTDTSGDGLLDAEELSAQRQTVGANLVNHTRDRVSLTVDGLPIEIVGAGVPSLTEVDGDVAASAYAVLVLASADHDGDVSDVALAWDFDSPSSKVLLSTTDGVVTGNLGDEHTIAFSLSAWSSASSFFDLGVEHIQFGPDHLLFLVVLTLAAVGTDLTTATTWRTIKLVTAFTVGHAVSLGLAFFEVVSVPAALVEPAISLSIVAAAILAIRGSSTEARPVLAALVGVIHGLGFASNLSSLGVAASQQLTALAAFNLGVDIAQTVVVLVLIAGLWLSSRVLSDRISWVRIGGATAAAVFGIAWTVTRVAEFSA